MDQPNRIDYECLELATHDCRGAYTVVHLTNFQALAQQNLVVSVDEQTPGHWARFWRITPKGQERLQQLHTQLFGAEE